MEIIDDVQEGATNPRIPYIGEIGSVAAVVALIMGMVLFQFLEPISETLASAISNFVTDLTGFDLEQGEQADTGGAFD